MLEIESAPIFDLSYFFATKILCDCQVIIDEEVFHAHRAVLANGSEFFFNAFTSGMQEDETASVVITFNPENVLPKALMFLYCGRIQILTHELFALIEVAHFYGIEQLLSCIQKRLGEVITPDNVIECVNQCYKARATFGLSLLVPFLQHYFHPGLVSAWSGALDIGTFCAVLEGLAMSKTMVVEILNSFLGDFVPSPEEILAMDRVVAKGAGKRPCVACRWHS
jgi:hypothetical protein